jgi:hypothetical protein
MSSEKTWTEIVLMPIVVAAVGVFGTLLVTGQQADNASLARKTELEKTQEIADADRQIKILEIFSEKITSQSEEDRILALKLLTALDGALAGKLAAAVSESSKSDSLVKIAAQVVIEKSKLSGNSFPVILSTKDFEVANKAAKEIENQNLPFKPAIYLAENGYFGLTLGGNLSLAEARKRTKFAKEINISKDAYVRSSMSWGENLFQSDTVNENTGN